MSDAQLGSFDYEAWKDALFDSNSWAEELEHSISELKPVFVSARQNACIERVKEGKEKWNVWAESTLQSRRELENAGKWKELLFQEELGEALYDREMQIWMAVCK